VIDIGPPAVDHLDAPVATGPAGPTAIALTIIGIVITAGVAASSLLYRTASDAVVPRWQASQYWLDYSGGFVRRGLPGELLAVVVGGVPSYLQMAILALAITVSAVAAVIALIAMVCRSIGSRAAEWAVGGVLMTSPFTVSLVVWDLGRYDGVGVIVLAVTAAWGRSGSARTLIPGLAAVCGALVAAAATEEFLIAYLAPVAIIAVRARFAGRSPRFAGIAGPIGIALGPALLIVLASVLVAPQRAVVEEAIRQAQHAGVRITDRYGTNALVALLQGPADAIALAARVSITTQVLCLLGCAAFLVGTGWLLWYWSGRPTLASHRLVLAGYCVLAAAMGLVGVDYRRWWGLALMSLLGCLAIVLARPARPSRPARATRAIADAGPPPGRSGRIAHGLVGAVMVVSIAGQLMPVHPSWEPAFGRKPAPLVQLVDRLITG
jgi:hypothetical protein